MQAIVVPLSEKAIPAGKITWKAAPWFKTVAVLKVNEYEALAPVKVDPPGVTDPDVREPGVKLFVKKTPDVSWSTRRF